MEHVGEKVQLLPTDKKKGLSSFSWQSNSPPTSALFVAAATAKVLQYESQWVTAHDDGELPGRAARLFLYDQKSTITLRGRLRKISQREAGFACLAVDGEKVEDDDAPHATVRVM